MSDTAVEKAPPPFKRGPRSIKFLVFQYEDQVMTFMDSVDARSAKSAIEMLARLDGEYVAVPAKYVRRYMLSTKATAVPA